MKHHKESKHKGGGGVVWFLQNVENTFFGLLVYSLQPVFRKNLHLQENMKIYNLHVENRQIYNT